MSSPPSSLSDVSSVSVMEKITDQSEDSGFDSIVSGELILRIIFVE